MLLGFTMTASASGASPRLGEPSQYRGEWLVEAPGVPPCRFALATSRVEAANAFGFERPPRCLAALLGAEPAGWRPAPDGLDLADADGLSLAFFASGAEGFSARGADGTVLRLRRAG